MLLRLPASLHYPITVTELLKQPNDNVERFAPLFSYFYKTTVTEGDELGNENQVEKTFPTRFESSVEGILKSWKIKRGAVIASARTSYVTERLDATRATINMVHNNVSLTVSQAEATRVEDEAKRRLLASKKLSLVVDLDQTIIHATVDPTVADWQKDSENPNHEAVKDVRAFLLKDDGPGNKGCWYYVKLRPGLEQFLENVSKIYELHIYTMGTRQYAKNIADIIDPDHKVFGDRILSRDESGSMTAKNLQRLFPVDTKMVVIIDDRGDVWKWSPNLIKVTPYDFFVGIGDINSSFLPKKPDLKPSSKAVAATAPQPNKDLAEGATREEPEPTTNGAKHSDVGDQIDVTSEMLVDANTSPLDRIVAMGGGNDATNRQAQTSSQDEAIIAQLEERPLLQKQKQLEADDAAAAEATVREDSDESKSLSVHSTESDKPKHNLLQDHDRELYQLENSLRTVHAAFFDAYTQQLAAAQGGRLGQLRGSHKRKLGPDASDLDLVPDIKAVMPAVKSKVLGSTVIVLSGMVPLGMDIACTDIAIQATSFGAKVEEEVTKTTTHLVAARNRTQKVRTAMRRGKGRIKVVSPQWLYGSINSWSKLDEQPYLLDVEESKNGTVEEEDDDLWSESESLAEDESEDTDTDTLDKSSGKSPKLKLTTKGARSEKDEYESDVEGVAPPDFEFDEKSPVGGTDEDWSAMNDELKDFLGSEAEDSEDDNTSVASEKSNASSRLSVRGKKRGREENESGGESDGGSKVKKKQATGTSLSQTSFVNDETDDTAEADEEPAKEGDGWSDFGDEDFEAELEKAMSDGQEDTSLT
ncbi:MAG: hypothetical protein Q9217_004535 [Psora testacea]